MSCATSTWAGRTSITRLPRSPGPAGDYRYPVELDRLPPAALRAYPLIVTRRDPSADRPPSAYSLLWQGTYYQVWGRRHGAPAAIAAVGAVRLARANSALASGAWRGSPAASGATLVAASSPQIVRISLHRASHPAGWDRVREGLLMNTPGRLSAEFAVPHAGVWDVWLQGQIMPTVTRRAWTDIRSASIGAQLGGNSVVLQHHHPAARLAFRRPPSPVARPRRLQPRPGQRRLGGPLRPLPHPGRRSRASSRSHGRARPLAVAVRRTLLDRVVPGSTLVVVRRGSSRGRCGRPRRLVRGRGDCLPFSIGGSAVTS